MKPEACFKCGGQIQQLATGRPRRFCSDACRVAANYEIRRLNVRLQSLETDASRLRYEPDHGVKDWVGRTHAQHLAAAEAEIADAEARLRQLLEGTNDDD
jgi:hypothetical protein